MVVPGSLALRLLALGLLSGQAFICNFFTTWPDASQAFASQFDPMGVVNETVEDRIGVGWVVDDLTPAVHGELGCDDGGAAAVSLFEDFQDIVTSGGVGRLQSPIVARARSSKAIVRLKSILPVCASGHAGAPLFLLMNCHRARQVLRPKMAYTYLP
jgi:hypothetical protein